MDRLHGKVAIVTGGGNGVGKEHALLLASEGAMVVVNDLGENAESTASEINNSGGKAISVQGNVAEWGTGERLVSAAIESFGDLHILINNAGINKDNLSLRMKDEDWQKVIDINLSSTFLLSKYAIKKMLKGNSGRVINITSIVGHTGNIGQSNYAASKAGTIGMSKSLSIEYAKKNITINCVSPGFIVSDMTNSIPEKIRSILLSKIPMGKMGSGDDVSNCVAFLSSDEASYITGETIHVNGGMYMA